MIRSAVGSSCSQCRQLRPVITSPAAYLSLGAQQYQRRSTYWYECTNSYTTTRMIRTQGITTHPRSIRKLRMTSISPIDFHRYFIQSKIHFMALKRGRKEFSVSQIPNCNLFVTETSRSFSHSLLQPRHHQRNDNAAVPIRWSSSSNSNSKDKSESASDKNSTPPTTSAADAPQSMESLKTEATPTSSPATESENVSSNIGANAASAESSSQHTNHPPSGKAVSDAVVAATHELEQRIKRVVRGENLTIGDQLSVAFIAIFTTILLTAPYAVRHMKQRANTVHGYEDRLQTDDPVDEFVKLARHEWSMMDGNVDDTEANNGNEEKNQKFIEVVLNDVLQSKTVQHAAQEFVVQIIQSERFQSTIQHFVKELWNDLITDPETVAQVIKLLEIAITSTPIKNAVIELILQIAVRETEFRDAMIQMIQSLGMDDDVRNAVVKLLTEATHTALNDPDIFDHSMEFATDVVGDDIVQKTAGEALRKSVEHAVKPATTIILSACGVGLLIFSFIALGYSRSTETEARVFASAARSLHSNAAIGMSRILNWPFRTLPNMVIRTFNTICNGLSTPLHQVSKSVQDALSSFALNIISSSWKRLQSAGHLLSSKSSKILQNVSASIYKQSATTIRSIGIWIGTSAVAMAAIMESGIRTVSINTWTSTVQGFKYVGHGFWNMTSRASAYVGTRITNCITAIYNSMMSYEEW